MSSKEPAKAPEAQHLRFGDDEFDVDKYNEIVYAAQLVDLRQIGSSYSVKVECMDALERDSDLKRSFDGQTRKFSFDLENGVAIGTVEWLAEIKIGRKIALKLEAEYLVVYNGLEGMEVDYARLYFCKVARFATYPYFRALFGSSASCANICLPPLPSLIDRID